MCYENPRSGLFSQFCAGRDCPELSGLTIVYQKKKKKKKKYKLGCLNKYFEWFAMLKYIAYPQ
jgi:hypothetical protein